MNTAYPVRSLSLASFSRVDMTPSTADWWKTVPAKPGWYAIDTNTPISLLKSAPPPPEQGKNYRLADRVAGAKCLLDHQLAIVPTVEGGSFVVYSGEHHDLKARAREHTHGNKGTGCLRLSQYPDLCAYQWSFLYMEFASHVSGCSDDKILRTLLEQKWRAENGWPILCSK